MNMIRRYFNEVNKNLFFTVLVLFYILIGFILNEYIIKDELYYRTLGEQLAYDRIEQLLKFKHHWDWIGYLIIPFVLFFKFLFVATCLETGALFRGYKTNFKKMFHVAMLSELIFLVAQIIKTLIIAFSKLDNLSEIQYVGSFSLLSVIGSTEIDKWFMYPLQTFNIFEICYWFFMAYVLKIILEKSYNRMLGFVFSTYGIGLVIWIVVVMFINVNIA